MPARKFLLRVCYLAILVGCMFAAKPRVTVNASVAPVSVNVADRYPLNELFELSGVKFNQPQAIFRTPDVALSGFENVVLDLLQENQLSVSGQQKLGFDYEPFVLSKEPVFPIDSWGQFPVATTFSNDPKFSISANWGDQLECIDSGFLKMMANYGPHSSPCFYISLPQPAPPWKRMTLWKLSLNKFTRFISSEFQANSPIEDATDFFKEFGRCDAVENEAESTFEDDTETSKRIQNFSFFVGMAH